MLYVGHDDDTLVSVHVHTSRDLRKGLKPRNRGLVGLHHRHTVVLTRSGSRWVGGIMTTIALPPESLGYPKGSYSHGGLVSGEGPVGSAID